VYAAVSLGLLTFLGNDWKKPKPIQLFIFLFFGYLAFAISNCYEIWGWQITINTIISTVEVYVNGNTQLIGSLYYPLTQNFIVAKTSHVVLTHLFFDLLILMLICCAGYASHKANKSLKQDK